MTNKTTLTEEELEKVTGGAFGDNTLEVLAQILICLQPYGHLIFEYPNDKYIISQLNIIASADLSLYPINESNPNIIELKQYLKNLSNQ